MLKITSSMTNISSTEINILTVFLLVLPSNTIFFGVAWQGLVSGTGHLLLMVVLSNTIFLFSLELLLYVINHFLIMLDYSLLLLLPLSEVLRLWLLLNVDYYVFICHYTSYYLAISISRVNRYLRDNY